MSSFLTDLSQVQSLRSCIIYFSSSPYFGISQPTRFLPTKHFDIWREKVLFRERKLKTWKNNKKYRKERAFFYPFYGNSSSFFFLSHTHRHDRHTHTHLSFSLLWLSSFSFLKHWYFIWSLRIFYVRTIPPPAPDVHHGGTCYHWPMPLRSSSVADKTKNQKEKKKTFFLLLFPPSVTSVIHLFNSLH